MPAGHVGVFCQNLSITAYNYKSKFLFDNGSILEMIIIIEAGER